MFPIRQIVQLFATVILVMSNLVSSVSSGVPMGKRDMSVPSKEVSETFTLTEDYVIVRGENCVASEVTAAETLQKYLKQINGVTYEITTDTAPACEKEIIVGKTNREGKAYTVDRSAMGNEGVWIKTVGEKLIISGAETRGTLYAVYEFLKIYLDCRWYTAELTVVPQSAEIKIPKDIYYTFVPPLYYRSTYFTNCSSSEFCTANHLNGGAEGFGAGGTLFSFAPPSEYFEAHPEYYSLINGERQAKQLCMTNADVLNVVIENVQKCIDENPTVSRIQISPEAYEDCPPCECESCKALNDAEALEDGSCSGSFYRFTNAVAEHFRDSYPNIKFAVLAYGNNTSPPTTFTISDNVAVEFAVTAACYAHRLTDSTCKNNVTTMKQIEEWKAAAKSLEVFDYIADYGHYVGIYPIFHVLQSDIQCYVENNVVGIFGLGNGYSDAVGGFDNLMGYLLSNLYWNPYTDCNRLMIEFCQAYFGDAAQNIIQYLDIACYRAENSKNPLRQHITMSEDMHDGGIATLTASDREYINQLWDEAKSFELTEAQRKNVFHAEICWRYWKASNHVDEFSLSDIEAEKAAAQQLLDDMKSIGINRVCEGEPDRGFSDNPNLIRAPFYWQKRWDGDWAILKYIL